MSAAITTVSHGEETGFDNLTLEDLLNMKTAVATRTEMTPRNSPNSITVVTADEISNSGARDLMDVLLLVPGIGFGNDSFGAASIGMRGMWANEGKVLLLFDGLEMNEILFSTVQFGNRYPVDQIKRVEIIRGPGSALYGGFAELAVINVITKDGESLNGCQFSGKYGQMEHTWARRNVSAACGKKLDSGMNISVAAFSGQGHRSDRIFTGYSGESTDNDPSNDANTLTQTYRFSGNRLDPMFINFGLSNDVFRFRYIREFYEMTTTSGYGYLDARRPVYSSFYGQYLGLEYDFKPTAAFKITPFVQYKTQKPWQTVDTEIAGSVVSNFTADRLKAGVLGAYDLGDISFLAGYTRTQDWGLNENFQSYQATFAGGGSRIGYYTDSVLGQGLFNLGFANLTVGARYDQHQKVNGAFSPRLALTKSEATWHAKMLAAGAFRAPTIMNLDSNPDIKPDRTTTYEIEAGHRLSGNTYLTLNLFKSEIKDPIIYGIDPAGATHNFNAERTSTLGGELEFRLKDSFGYATLSYSYYRADGKNPDVYHIDGHDDLLLGFPGHKVTLNSSFNTPLAHFKINPTATYMSPYYAYNWDASRAERYFERLAPGVLANLFLLYEDLGTRGFNLGAGVFNIFDVDWRLAQPYQSGNHAPMPTASREFVLRADYNLSF
jgi:outer membrane cobalamin receptor